MKTFFKKYERYLVPGFLIGGFVVDVLTFHYVETRTVFTVLGIYVLLAGIAIFFIHNPRLYHRLERSKLIRFLRTAAPLVLQFTFGALLSASLIFYWFSGALSVSWPFILLIAALAGGNEAFREYYLKPIVQLPIYFFTLFSYFTLVFPFIFKSIHPGVFYASGLLSLAIMLAYTRDFSRFNNVKLHQRKYLTWSIVSIFAAMNVLYVTNVIPPIPLSIRDAGVYHHVQRTGSNYTLLEEEKSFFDRIIPGQTIHVQEGQSVYVFTSIFAPSDLNTTIFHQWEFYDQGRWVKRTRPSYHISGGRQEGYRGFSFVTVEPGRWRVDVETEKGQTMGRVKFTVEPALGAPVVNKIIR